MDISLSLSSSSSSLITITWLRYEQGRAPSAAAVRIRSTTSDQIRFRSVKRKTMVRPRTAIDRKAGCAELHLCPGRSYSTEEKTWCFDGVVTQVNQDQYQSVDEEQPELSWSDPFTQLHSEERKSSSRNGVRLALTSNRAALKFTEKRIDDFW